MTSPAAAFHPSNLLTYLSLVAGLGSMMGALQGSTAAAGALLAAAALCDTFDGWFARRFVRSTELQALGAQLDSLTDAVAFGVAPVVATSVLIGASGADASAAWWLAAAGYAACALARLAFYNVSGGNVRFRDEGERAQRVSPRARSGDQGAPARARVGGSGGAKPTRRDGFVGIPAPAAALAWSSALAFNPSVTTVTLLAAALGAAMIAPLTIPRPGRAGLTVFAAWPLVLLVVHLS